MSFLGNRLYIILTCLWIMGLYFVLSIFHFTSSDNTVPTDEIQYLKNEVELLKQKLLEAKSQSTKLRKYINSIKYDRSQILFVSRWTSIRV